MQKHVKSVSAICAERCFKNANFWRRKQTALLNDANDQNEDELVALIKPFDSSDNIEQYLSADNNLDTVDKNSNIHITKI